MLMWPPCLLSTLITLLSHFNCHICLSLLPQVLNPFLIFLKLIGLDYFEYLLNYDFDLLFHDDDNEIVW